MQKCSRVRKEGIIISSVTATAEQNGFLSCFLVVVALRISDLEAHLEFCKKYYFNFLTIIIHF